MGEIEVDVLQSILHDHVGLIIFDKKGKIKYLSPKLKLLFNLPEKHLKGNYKGFGDIPFVDELGNQLPRDKNPITTFFNQAQLVDSTRLGIKIENKGIQWLNIYCKEFYEDNELSKMAVYIHETDFSKENVIESCSFHIFHQLMDHFSGACFVQDLQGIVYYGNHRYFKETGLKKEEIIGKSYHGLYSDEMIRNFYSQDKLVLEKDCAMAFEDSMGEKTFLTTKFPIHILGHKDMVGGIAIDITELKKNEKSLQYSEIELKKINETKDRLFSILAHDLRSPFATIYSLIDLLKEEKEELTEREKDMIYLQLKNLSNAFISLLDNLLNWSKTQSGGVKVHRKKHELYRLVESAVAMSRQNAKEKKIDIINNIPLDLKLDTDYDILSTVVRNLTCNAVKFSNVGECVEIEASKEEGKTCIRVIDKGIGMNTEELKKILDRNLHYSTSGTEGEKGTGLGLLICQQFSELLDGEMSVSSIPKKGSVFTLKF